MNRTDRLYAIVEELRAAAPRPKTVAQLAGHFEVTERTMHRDLLALQEAGVPLWSQPGPGGGYHVDPAMTLPPINLTSVEAMAIAVALAHTESSPFAASARSALQKIASALSKGTADEVQRVASRIRIVPSKRPNDVRATIEEAVTTGRVLIITYEDRDGTTTERAVEPNSFLNGRGHWYLIGWCRIRNDGRGFRLDRIRSALLTDEVAPERQFSEVGGDLKDIAITPQILEAFTNNPATSKNSKMK
jgi:predicted DNA-binding transcriptional regulator YafY